MFNALKSPDRTEPLFPVGHPLRRLVRPTFDTIRRALRGRFVATIWMDAVMDPSRAGFRPSYEALHGPGAGHMMAFVAAWLSTGPGSERGGNVALFTEDVDATLLAYAERVGLLGPWERVKDLASLHERLTRSTMRIYNIDDLGVELDPYAVVSSALARRMSSKDALAEITGFGPVEIVKDMYDVTRDDFAAAARDGGRVFLKTCNTENAGLGVYIARDADELERHVQTIREQQARFGLRRQLVVQPEIRGKNRSFQVLLDPEQRGEIQVVALSDQLVEADGKTYRSSINHPITPENVEPVGAAILDMVDRVWAQHPEAFGFMMSDYFATESGPVIYDPALRPTGNTATALAAHLARKLTGRHFTTSLLPFPTGKAGLTFEGFARRAGRLVDPQNLISEGRAVMPWGWNPVQGFGMLIVVAPDQAGVDALSAEVHNFTYD